jgi:putative spermidine/putrescine transport system substrate-binding protein
MINWRKKQLMKKIVAILSILSMTVLLLSGCASGNDSGKGKKTELVISTWGFDQDFFNKEIYAPFEKENNVKIVVETGNNADRLNKIRQGNSKVDVMYLSDYFAQQAIDEGLFEKIDASKLTNLKELYPIAQAPLGKSYGPAYTISRLGIVYNTKSIKTKITSWNDLWDTNLKGKLTLPSITSTSGPMLVDIASNHSGKTFNEDEAFKNLKLLNKNTVKYYNQTSDFVNMFAQGEAAVGPMMEMYYGDIKKAEPAARFVVPSDGAYAIQNTLNVVKGSKHKALAEKFINWAISKKAEERSAKAKIDSPANKTVKLNKKQAEGLTYGSDAITALKKMDMEFVNKNLKSWITRWNQEIH